MNNNWESIFLEEFDKSYFQNLIHFIEKEEAKYTVFPKKEERFNAFKLTPFEKVKCVITRLLHLLCYKRFICQN